MVLPNVAARQQNKSRFRPNSSRIQQLDRTYLKPSPENDDIYGAIRPDQPATVRLIESIESNGLLEPLRVARDRYIISGHRRYCASGVIGLTHLPCIVADIRRSDHTKAEWKRVLCQPNEQRSKSVAVQIREAAIATDADLATACFAAFREETNAGGGGSRLVIIKGDRKVKPISWKKQPLVDAINRVLERRRKFWPLTLRGVHYALCHLGPLTDAINPKSKYINTKKCYGILKRILKPARLLGEVPMEAINDPTRPCSVWNVWESPADFARDQFKQILNGYARNLQQSQRSHIEIVVEKNSALPAIEPVANSYHITLTSARGYPSLPAINDIVDRFQSSGKGTLELLVVSDHDPEGFDIANSLALDLRDSFGVPESVARTSRIALTPDQIEKYRLTEDLEAKTTSSRYAAYITATGTTAAYELEALAPEVLAEVVRQGIEAVMDMDAYNADVAQHRMDAKRVAAARSEILNYAMDIEFALSDEPDE